MPYARSSRTHGIHAMLWASFVMLVTAIAPAGAQRDTTRRAPADSVRADSARVAQVVRLGAHGAVFGLLAVLDSVRRLGPAGGRFELTHVAPDGARTLLNPPRGPEMLHDPFQGHVREAVFGPPAT